MFRPFVFLIVLCFCTLSSAFRAPSTMRPVGRAALSSLRMEDEEKPAWVGAKKFSMKDRYTETVIDSENISKILPHRYPFVIFIIYVTLMEFNQPNCPHLHCYCLFLSPYFSAISLSPTLSFHLSVYLSPF